MTQFNQIAQQDGAHPLEEVLLEARMCSKTYTAEGKQSAHAPLVLDCVDLQIRSGEFVALLGPSGSGKSTLLRILAGLLEPSSGQVFFKGAPQHGPNPHVAIVFQSFALFPWLTVLQNVELGLEAQDLTRTQRLKRALAAIDMIGLDGFEDAFPKELSGGMRQRVGFARALVVEPELLFMDEPFSGLDPVNTAQMIEAFGEMRQCGKTIIFSTHQMEQAEELCQAIAIIDRGRLVVHGDVRSVKRSTGRQVVRLALAGPQVVADREGDVRDDRAVLEQGAALEDGRRAGAQARSAGPPRCPLQPHRPSHRGARWPGIRRTGRRQACRRACTRASAGAASRAVGAERAARGCR